jgi:hypothetical protein
MGACAIAKNETPLGRCKLQEFSNKPQRIRGVLGNKCAGHYNLKTVHFRETLASDNFLACSSAISVFLQRSIYHRTAGASFYVMMVGVTPLKALLEGALGQQAACQL